MRPIIVTKLDKAHLQTLWDDDASRCQHCPSGVEELIRPVLLDLLCVLSKAKRVVSIAAPTQVPDQTTLHGSDNHAEDYRRPKPKTAFLWPPLSLSGPVHDSHHPPQLREPPCKKLLKTCLPFPPRFTPVERVHESKETERDTPSTELSEISECHKR